MRNDDPRYRSKQHLQWIASKPCIICGRTDVQAHHLTQSQKQAMSLKVGDQFTVPLCVYHHDQLHRLSEKKFWEKYSEVDADGQAKRFWDENKGGLGDITIRSQQNNSKTKRVRKRANRKTSTLRGANRLKEIKERRASLGISQWGKGTWGKRDASKRK